MIKERTYKAIRDMKIDEDIIAIFSKTIINRFKKSVFYVDGKKEVVHYKKMGEVIDSIIDGSFFYNKSLSRWLRQDILDYLKVVGVIEYLENTCEQYNQTMIALAEHKAAKAKEAEQSRLKRRAEAKEKRLNSQNNLQQ